MNKIPEYADRNEWMINQQSQQMIVRVYETGFRRGKKLLDRKGVYL